MKGIIKMNISVEEIRHKLNHFQIKMDEMLVYL